MNGEQADPAVGMQLQEVSKMLRGGEAGPALQLLTRLDREFPGRADVKRMRGMVLSLIGRDAEAEPLLRQVAELLPGSLDAASDHAHVLLNLGDIEHALEVLRRHAPAGSAAAWGPETATFSYNLGRALKAAGLAGEAVAPLQQTLKWQPQHYAAMLMLGDVNKALGDIRQAATCYRQAIAIQPADGTAWWSLSNLKTEKFDDAEFDRLKALAAAAPEGEQEVFFEFALASGFDQRDQLDQAFAHYQAGNRRKRQLEPWDRREFSDWLMAIRRSEKKWDIPPRPETLEGPRPVFLVSLPRSGSTLTEQILAAHSAVTAAGELPWLPRLMAKESRSRRVSIVDWGARLSREEWQVLGEQYLAHCRDWYRETPVFTDKLPGNIPYVGAILAMFPDALVINIRRDAMDVCWSCYRQLFIGGAGFASDLQDLAAYWKDHEQHMAYWQERAPGRVLNVDYEKLVQQPEEEIRRILAFLGLPFESACLSSHEVQRAVNTPSAAQVRQAISAAGIGHWRRYAPYLGELLAAFGKSVNSDSSADQ